jgi:hypothetical protein
MDSHHHAHIFHRGIENLKSETNPLKGAGLGAAAAGSGATALLGAAGLALTPVGWVVALSLGAAAGATYVANQLKK